MPRVLHPPDIFYDKHAPFTRLNNFTIESFAEVAREAGTFFTVRSHSFDVLGAQILNNPNVIRAINDPLCRFVHAKKSDVDGHIGLLYRLWS